MPCMCFTVPYYEQVTIESIGDPPQIVVARLNRVIRELNECGIRHTLQPHWIRKPLPERPRQTDDEGEINTYNIYIYIYINKKYQEVNCDFFRNCF